MNWGNVCMKRLIIENLYTSYKNKKEVVNVLNGVSLELGHNEIIVILGPSGCGKTTLLKNICGTLDYDSGSILINGIDANRLSTQERNLAFVSQSFFTYDYLTVYNNIALPLKAMKVPIEEIERRVNYISKKLGIDFLLSRKPKVLSGGQRQKVALARALVKNPDIYLFDEPFSNLDPLIRVELRKEIKKIKAEYNASMIFVTHDINDAIDLADRVFVMEDGVFIKELTKEQLCKDAMKYIYEE